MTHRKFIRAATALLMVLALTLPVATPALATAPVANSITTTTAEDTPLVVTLSATDVDACTEQVFSIVTGPSSGTLSGITNVACTAGTDTATVTYTPTANFNGVASFTYKANDGTTDSNTATVTITVTPVNDAPVANTVTPTTAEDTPVVVTLSASDADTCELTFSIVSGPSSGALSAITNNACAAGSPNTDSATVTYTPTANFNGGASFTYKANDGVADSNTATVTITVNAVNDAPVANAVTTSTPEDTPVVVTLRATDVDACTEQVFNIVTGPASGTLSVITNVACTAGTDTATVTYTPAANFNGLDSFTYKVNDGTADSNTATVTITVTAGNDPPTISDVPNQTIAEDGTTGALAITVGDVETASTALVMSGSSDNTTLVPNANIVFGGAGANRAVTVTPAANRFGTATITLTVTDGGGATASDTFVLTVTSVTDPVPVVTDFTPVTGPETGGTVVKITGTNLSVATSASVAGIAAVLCTATDVPAVGCKAPTSTDQLLVVTDPDTTPPPNAGLVCVTTDSVPGCSTTFFTYTDVPGFPGETVSGTITRTDSTPDTAGEIDVILVNKASGAILKAVTGPGDVPEERDWKKAGVPAGTWQVTAVDRLADYSGCDLGAICGNQPATTVITVDGEGTTKKVNLTLAAKLAPQQATELGKAGVFGFVVDAATGAGVGGAKVQIVGDDDTIVTTAINGRFEIRNVTKTGGAITVKVTTLPAGASCIFCEDAIADTDLTNGKWTDPVLVLQGALPIGVGVTRLEAVVPLIAESPDTSRTGGVDFNTRHLRIANAGNARVRVDVLFHNSDSDGRRSGGGDPQRFDLNPGAVAIVSGNLIPSGILGQAEIFATDIGFGHSDLQATVAYDVATAGGAEAGTNALNTEDFVSSAEGLSRMVVFPVLYKNYGGGAHQHSSVGQICLTTGVPARQPVVMRFWATGDTRGGPWFETRSIDPGGCITFNTRDLGFLPDKSTFALAVTSTGTLGPIFGTPGPDFADFRPGGVSGGSISYSTTGKVATASNAHSTPTGETKTGDLELFAGLVFHKNRGWNSGLAVTNFTEDGRSGSASISLVIYDEAGRLVCTLGDRTSNERQLVFYLPKLPCALPDNFQGTAIIRGSEVSGNARPFVTAMHVNYDQWQMISYNATRQDALVGPEAIGAKPCAPNVTCMWVTEALKQTDGRGNPSGPNTGIRIFNPRGGAATVTVKWFDSSGVEFIDARIAVTLPGFGTATFFLPHNDELPPFWTGGARIESTAEVVGLGQVRDYSVSGRDGSRAFNLANQTGKTQ